MRPVTYPVAASSRSCSRYPTPDSATIRTGFLGSVSISWRRLDFYSLCGGNSLRVQLARDRLDVAVGREHPDNVLLQQIQRYREKDQILHQKWHVTGHRWKASSGIPSIWHERDNRKSCYKGYGCAKGTKNSEPLVPESCIQQRADRPLRRA